MVSKHDRIIDSLEQIVRETPVSGKNLEYGTSDYIIGELDYFMYRNGHLWLFEIKGNPKNNNLYLKAKSQMKRASKYFPSIFEEDYNLPIYKIHTYYVTNHYSGRTKKIKPRLEHLETIERGI